MSAEEYLRSKYGAYKGHFAWRELEEAFNAGAAKVDAVQVRNDAADILEAMAHEEPINGNELAQICVLMAAGRVRRGEQPFYCNDAPDLATHLQNEALEKAATICDLSYEDGNRQTPSMCARDIRALKSSPVAAVLPDQSSTPQQAIDAGKMDDVPLLASGSFLTWQDDEGPKTGDQCSSFYAGYFRGNSERPMYSKDDAARRYEIVRKLNVPQFQKLYKRNIAGEGRFDDLVDQLGAQAIEAKL